MSHRNERNGKTTPQLNALAAEAQAILREAFDAEFECWLKEPAHEWVCSTAFRRSEAGDTAEDRLKAGLQTVPQDPASSLDLPALLERSVSTREPLITPVADNQYILVLPLVLGQRVTAAAIGYVRDKDADVIHRLARSVLRTLDAIYKVSAQEQQLGAYARQLSQSFEELAWLRVLAGQIEYCDASSQIAVVAAKVLPSLCDVLGAESLALIRAPDDPGTVHDLDDSMEVSCTVGEVTFADDVYCQLVHCFAADAMGQPCVHNDLDDHETFTDAEALHACMVVHLAKGERCYGWLVAVNKVSAEWSGRGSLGPKPYRKSECEFGTIEAGLMDSASVMLATHARNAELFRESESLFIGVIRALAGAIDAKDPYTCGHSDRVARIAKRLARELGLDSSDCEQVYLAGLLHDIGKIGIRDDILLKPGRLTDDEFEEIKKHPVIGFAILRHVQHLQHALPGVLHHHERIDGMGYPGELVGTETPLLARIIAVADAYDAMTADRPYRKAMPFEKAEAILRENTGSQWDAKVVEAFFSALADIHNICADSIESCLDTLTVGHVRSAPIMNETDENLDPHAVPASVSALTGYMAAEGS